MGGFVGAIEPASRLQSDGGLGFFRRNFWRRPQCRATSRSGPTVDGMMTTDPRLCPGARRIKVISFDEAAELAYFGPSLHPATVMPEFSKIFRSMC